MLGKGISQLPFPWLNLQPFTLKLSASLCVQHDRWIFFPPPHWNKVSVELHGISRQQNAKSCSTMREGELSMRMERKKESVGLPRSAARITAPKCCDSPRHQAPVSTLRHCCSYLCPFVPKVKHSFLLRTLICHRETAQGKIQRANISEARGRQEEQQIRPIQSSTLQLARRGSPAMPKRVQRKRRHTAIHCTKGKKKTLRWQKEEDEKNHETLAEEAKRHRQLCNTPRMALSSNSYCSLKDSTSFY